MNCPKCGKENENDAAFCGFCGAALEGAAAPAPVPKGKKRWVPPLCIAAAVIAVTVGVGILLSAIFAPIRFGNTKNVSLTVNGEEIPLDLAYFFNDDFAGMNDITLRVAGKGREKAFLFQVLLYPENRVRDDCTFYMTSEKENEVTSNVSFWYNDSDGSSCLASTAGKKWEAAIIVIEYISGREIAVSVSGTALSETDGGEIFSFVINGIVEFAEENDAEEAYTKWRHANFNESMNEIY